MKDNYPILSTHWGLLRETERQKSEGNTDYANKPSQMRIIKSSDMPDNEFVLSDGTPEGTKRFEIEE